MTPLIYTIKGNLPIDSLEYSHKWEETPGYIKFIETYKLGGEIVKQAAHVYMRHGNELGIEQESLNGQHASSP